MAVDFTRNIDAVAFYNGCFWFFKGDERVKVDGDGTKLIHGPFKITNKSGFPALPSN